MLRLHDSASSGNAYKVRLLLKQLGLGFQRVAYNIDRGETRTAAFLSTKNANGSVPVLELEDGRCLAESNAILWYLGEGTRPGRLVHPGGVDTGPVNTYYVYTMNVTIALSEDLVARVREIAQRQGTTLNELVRRQLELIAGRSAGQALADEMKKLWAHTPGHSGGKRIRRSDAYDPRRS